MELIARKQKEFFQRVSLSLYFETAMIQSNCILFNEGDKFRKSEEMLIYMKDKNKDLKTVTNRIFRQNIGMEFEVKKSALFMIHTHTIKTQTATRVTKLHNQEKRNLSRCTKQVQSSRTK